MDKILWSLVILIWVALNSIGYFTSSKDMPIINNIAIASNFIFGGLVMVDFLGFPNGIFPGIILGYIMWGFFAFGLYSVRRSQRNAVTRLRMLLSDKDDNSINK